jgi:hypothetical protein
MKKYEYFSGKKQDFTFWSRKLTSQKYKDGSNTASVDKELPYCQGRNGLTNRYDSKDKSLSALKLKNHDRL